MISWRELIVTNEGETWPGLTLGELVTKQPELFATATIEGGRISEWPDYFISAPGEDPDWNTPRAEVDWTGFEDALRMTATA